MDKYGGVDLRDISIRKIPYNKSYILHIKNEQEPPEELPVKSDSSYIWHHGTHVDPVEGYLMFLLYKSKFHRNVYAPCTIFPGRKQSIRPNVDMALEQTGYCLDGENYVVGGHSQGAIKANEASKELPGCYGIEMNNPPTETDKSCLEFIDAACMTGLNDLFRVDLNYLIRGSSLKGFHLGAVKRAFEDFGGIINFAKEFSDYSMNNYGHNDVPTLFLLSEYDEFYSPYKEKITRFKELFTNKKNSYLSVEGYHDFMMLNYNPKNVAYCGANFHLGTEMEYQFEKPRSSILPTIASLSLLPLVTFLARRKLKDIERGGYSTPIHEETLEAN